MRDPDIKGEQFALDAEDIGAPPRAYHEEHDYREGYKCGLHHSHTDARLHDLLMDQQEYIDTQGVMLWACGYVLGRHERIKR